MLRTIILAAMVALCLSACSGGEKKPESKAALTHEQVAAKASTVPKMRPGEYQTQTTLLDFDMPGLPAAQADSMRSMMSGQYGRSEKYCLTSGEADQGPRDMVRHLAQSNCKVSSLDTVDNVVHGEMQCAGKGGPSGTVTVAGTFASDSSTVVMDMTQDMPGMAGKSMHMKVKFESQRVGECPG